ncbi:organic cation transporter protein-like [Paramacrobiotus metropolitanus]|uniref:organic cation transporter protein-like n=1 Tax=Paramacrobiotus metropolitanus TaxID=2943436 RepID=UPI0024456EF6|nr:organic cation transporter protein-like [Paramacrobiotus metropolitanus]
MSEARKTNGAAVPAQKTFDDVFDVVGSFGRYQILIVVFVIIPIILPSGFLAQTSVFFAAVPNYACAAPHNFSWKSGQRYSWYLEDNETAPVLWFQNHTKGQSCHTVRLNATDVELPITWNGTDENVWNNVSLPMKDRITEACSEYRYNRSIYQETIVSEWNLVCSRRYMMIWSYTIFVVGGVIGPLFWGYLADRIGRKKGFYLCAVFQSAATILTGFSPNYVTYMICRLLVGMTSSASYTIPFVLTLEIVGREKRAPLAVVLSFTYSCGCLLFIGMAYFIREWRMLAGVSSLIATVLYIAPFYFFPESPRWLLAKGRYTELEEFLKKVAKINRRPMTMHFASLLPQQVRGVDREDHTKKHSPLDLFRTPNMRIKTLTLMLINTCNKGVSLGLNYYAPLFAQGSPHFTAFLNTSVEFFPYLFAKTAFQRLGRRTSLFLGLFICSMACLGTNVVPSGYAAVVTALTLIAKLCITFTYLNGKLFEDETFPTVIRSEGHSTVSLTSAMLSCGVPWIVISLGDEVKTLPLLVFGSLTIVGSFSTFLLPETVHQRLPQTLEDGEEFGKNMTLKERFRLLPRPKPKPVLAVPEDEEELETLKSPVKESSNRL